jgi:hypothetical protein
MCHRILGFHSGGFKELYHEHGDDTFVRNTGSLSTYYTAF